MGTVATFTLHAGGIGPDDVSAAVDGACAILHHADATFSTWDPQSPVSRLRRGEVSLGEVPPPVGEVLELCAAARDATAGYFDPWAMPGGVDPTGLVKGWAVERAVESLEAAGLAGGMVNAGGDLMVFGTAPPTGSPGTGPAPSPGVWRIGIRHPWRPDALACVIEARGAVATSGTYERGAHLVDPWTGEPACRSASATVTGPSLAMADAFATALAVGGDEALDAALWRGAGSYEAYLIRPDGSERATTGIVVVT